MRTIKFRAWDKKHSQMILPDWLTEIEWNSHDTPDSIEFNDGEGLLHIKEFELMQFTGLLDKNGTEIYEGDILQTRDYLGKVVFEDGMFELHSPQDENYHSLAGQASPEIIGNIYENSIVYDESVTIDKDLIKGENNGF
jgi:hypothetical protein